MEVKDKRWALDITSEMNLGPASATCVQEIPVWEKRQKVVVSAWHRSPTQSCCSGSSLHLDATGSCSHWSSPPLYTCKATCVIIKFALIHFYSGTWPVIHDIHQRWLTSAKHFQRTERRFPNLQCQTHRPAKHYAVTPKEQTVTGLDESAFKSERPQFMDDSPNAWAISWF